MRLTFARLAAALATLALSRPEAGGAEPTAMTAGSQGVDTTRLALAIAPHAAAHPGKSGIHALPSPSDAFAARMALAAAADRTLDIQYYIWHHDETGTLLLEALWQAAERGVRVRLLLDDSGTSGLDGSWRRSTRIPTSRFASTIPCFTVGSSRSTT